MIPAAIHLPMVLVSPGNRAGRPTAIELERRKAAIMKVATALFVRQGFAATSLTDIAKAAGVATRTIYQHFGDKDALFREVVFARDEADVVLPPMVEAGDTVFSALGRLSAYMTNFALRPRSIDLMRLMIGESVRYPDLMRAVAMATFTRFRGNVAAVFAALADRNLIPAGNHDATAALFVDLMLGMTPLLTYAAWAEAPRSDADTDTRIALFIRGAFGMVELQDQKTLATQAGSRRIAYTIRKDPPYAT